MQRAALEAAYRDCPRDRTPVGRLAGRRGSTTRPSLPDTTDGGPDRTVGSGAVRKGPRCPRRRRLPRHVAGRRVPVPEFGSIFGPTTPVRAIPAYFVSGTLLPVFVGSPPSISGCSRCTCEAPGPRSCTRPCRATVRRGDLPRRLNGRNGGPSGTPGIGTNGPSDRPAESGIVAGKGWTPPPRAPRSDPRERDRRQWSRSRFTSSGRAREPPPRLGVT